MKKAPISAGVIREAMSARWTDPEWAIMWEVADATGTQQRRYADAVMMSLWPSRGLELHGVEIKVSRADWKREAADPTKAEAIARYCDRWWIHTAPNVIDDVSDLPPAWGLREFDGKQWVTIREAEKTSAEPISRPFLAAMLRRADGLMKGMVRLAVDQARKDEIEERQKQAERRQESIQREVDWRMAEYERLKASFIEFQEAFGDRSLSEWGLDRRALGNAARELAMCNRHVGQPKDLVQRLRSAADAIEAVSSLFPEKQESAA